MKKTLFMSLFLLTAGTSLYSLCDEFIPQQSDYTAYNNIYTNRKLCGKNFWLANGLMTPPEEKAMYQLGLLDKLALIGKVKLTKGQQKRDSNSSAIAEIQYRWQLATEGKLPVIGNFYHWDSIKWDENKKLIVTKDGIPEINEINETIKIQGDSFLGWRPFNEWGNGLTYLINYAAGKGDPLTTPMRIAISNIGNAMFKGREMPPKSREDFEKAAHYAWDCFNKPYNYQTYVLDGTNFWAIQWPALWGCRAVITENRCPRRSMVVFQAVTRSAGRMGKIPWGYLSAFDWIARIAPPINDHMKKIPVESYQKANGNLNLHPNIYRRLWYYEFMGNAAIVADESASQMYSDLESDGTFRYSWYGEMCKEIMDFAELHPDSGNSYNPIGLLLSWRNGFEYKGSKAFKIFDYTPGEHMTREFINRVLYSFNEGNGNEQDIFGPTPYGDLYDVLRIDTPKGALPMELLKNYRVLICLGEQNMTPEVKERLLSYVKQGGALILNVKQMNGTFDSDSTGVKITDKESKAKSIKCEIDNKTIACETYTYTPLIPEKGTEVLYKAENGSPIVTRYKYGQGFLITVAAHWMLEDKITENKDETRRYMLPLANNMMEHIVKSVLPFRIEGDDIKNRILYQVNRKGTGWVVSIYNNSGRITQSTAGPEIVDISKRTTIKIITESNLRYATEWFKHEKCYFKSKEKENYLEFVLDPGDFRIVELQPEPIPDPVLEKKINLALNKKVTASSSSKGFPPEKTVDGKTGIRDAWWSSEACPQQLTVDLGKEEKISSFRLLKTWSADNNVFPRIYRWYIEASKDGKEWEKIASEETNITPATEQGVYRCFEPVNVRHVRLVITFNSSQQGAQIVEFEIFGDKKVNFKIPWKIDLSKIEIPKEISECKKTQWLSDPKYRPVSAKQGYKELTYDKECYTGQPIKIRGRTFKKGLGTHAISEINYKLDPKAGWKYFTSYIGIDDVSIPEGTVEYKIYVDGKLEYDSGMVTMALNPVPVWAKVEGAQELKLVVTDCGDGVQGDIADWADACLKK